MNSEFEIIIEGFVGVLWCSLVIDGQKFQFVREYQGPDREERARAFKHDMETLLISTGARKANK